MPHVQHTFKSLNIGERFTFLGEHIYLGWVKGPWCKISPRRYVHVDGGEAGGINRVGSIYAQVVKEV